MSLKWIPNALTVFRCALALIAAAALLLREAVENALIRAGLDWHAAGRPGMDEPGYPELLTRLGLSDLDQLSAVALGAFLLAMLTDWLDGFLARKLDARTPFGAWLDPIADKLLVGLVLIALSLTLQSWLVTVPAAIIICRDVFISWLRARLGGGFALPVMRAAKWKTALEMIALALMLASPLLQAGGVPEAAIPAAGQTLPPRLGLALLWVAAALSAWTGWVYWRSARDDSKGPKVFD